MHLLPWARQLRDEVRHGVVVNVRGRDFEAPESSLWEQSTRKALTSPPRHFSSISRRPGIFFDFISIFRYFLMPVAISGQIWARDVIPLGIRTNSAQTVLDKFWRFGSFAERHILGLTGVLSTPSRSSYLGSYRHPAASLEVLGFFLKSLILPWTPSQLRLR